MPQRPSRQRLSSNAAGSGDLPSNLSTLAAGAATTVIPAGPPWLDCGL